VATAPGVTVVVVMRRLMLRGWRFSLRVDLGARARGKDAQQGATRLFIEFLPSSFCASRRAAAIIPRALKFPAENGFPSRRWRAPFPLSRSRSSPSLCNFNACSRIASRAAIRAAIHFRSGKLLEMKSFPARKRLRSREAIKRRFTPDFIVELNGKLYSFLEIKISRNDDK